MLCWWSHMTCHYCNRLWGCHWSQLVSDLRKYDWPMAKKYWLKSLVAEGACANHRCYPQLLQGSWTRPGVPCAKPLSVLHINALDALRHACEQSLLPLGYKPAGRWRWYAHYGVGYQVAAGNQETKFMYIRTVVYLTEWI